MPVMHIQETPLLTQLQPVVSGHRGSAVAIWGEAGVGKSHAARQLLHNLDCPSASVPAVMPLAQLASLLPRPKRLPAWSVRSLDRLAGGEAIGTAGALTALGNLLTSLAPFILHVEDLHEAGQDSLELYRRMAHAVSNMPGVALLVTSRPNPGTPFTARHLLPLTALDSRQLLTSRAGAELPDTAIDWVYGRAAGNPLFTLEYWRHLTRQGWLYSDGQVWRWHEPPANYLPATVEALLEQLVSAAREDAASRQLLDALSFLPPSASATLRQAVSGLEPTHFQAVRHELGRQGILAGNQFAHPLFRQVARTFLTPDARQQLARLALSALQDEPGRAADFIADANLDADSSLQLLVRAADASRDSLQAARLRGQASQYATGSERSALAVQAARAMANSDRTGAISILTEVLDSNPDAADAAYLLAAYHAELGQSEDAEQILASQPADEPRLWEQRIGLRAAAGDYAGISNLWQQKPAGANPDPTTAYHIAFALMVQGDYAEAERIAVSSLQLDLPPLNRSQLLSVQGLCHYYLQDPEAGPLLDAALSAARASGAKLFVATCLYNRSMHLERTNNVSAMLADVREALGIYAEVGGSRLYASTLVKLARIEHELGNYEVAEESLLEARKILEIGEVSPYLVTCNAELASLYLDWEPPYGAVLALKYAQAAELSSRGMHARKRGLALTHLSLAEGRLGRHERALSLAEEVMQLLEPYPEMKETLPLRTLATALQGAGRLEEAAEEFARAEALAFEVDWHVYANKLGLQADYLCNDADRAAQRLAWFRQHGLVDGERLAERLFPQLATRQPPARLAAPLRLELLGLPRLIADGVEHPLQGQQRRQLLFLLLEARISGRDGVPRLLLLDSLYPGTDEIRAIASLKGLVYHLRQAFGPDLISTTPDGYALGNCSSDAEDFLQGGPTSLWRGPYPENTDQAGYVRDSLYLELAQRTAAAVHANPGEAARLAGLLTDADPYSLSHLRLRIQALRASASGRLPAVYGAARKSFSEVGEELPADWEEFLRVESD